MKLKEQGAAMPAGMPSSGSTSITAMLVARKSTIRFIMDSMDTGNVPMIVQRTIL